MGTVCGGGTHGGGGVDTRSINEGINEENWKIREQFPKIMSDNIKDETRLDVYQLSHHSSSTSLFTVNVTDKIRFYLVRFVCRCISFVSLYICGITMLYLFRKFNTTVLI